MEKFEQTPFAELPEALVEEMLSKSEKVGDRLYDSFKEIQESKEKIRKQLQEKNMLKQDSGKSPIIKYLFTRKNMILIQVQLSGD